METICIHPATESWNGRMPGEPHEVELNDFGPSITFPLCSFLNRREDRCTPALDARWKLGTLDHRSRMAALEWPSPDPTDDLGLVALDYNLSPERLISAYRHGIFPWPDSSPFSPIPWVCPPRRAILEFERLHVPRNLRKSRRALATLRFTIDQAFDTVIAACAAAPRAGQRGTWITPAMVAAYSQLHRLGQAHSVEAWSDDQLVGGLYGVSAAGVFTGESMFHRVDDASKLCVLHLVEHLRTRGSSWLDIQQLTPHFALLGAHEISREEFLALLAIERRANRQLFR